MGAPRLANPTSSETTKGKKPGIHPQMTRWENQGQEQGFVLPARLLHPQSLSPPSLASSNTCAPFPAGGIPKKTSLCHLPALLNPLKVGTEGMSTTYGYQLSLGPSIPPLQLGEQFTEHKFIQQISAHVLFANSLWRGYILSLWVSWPAFKLLTLIYSQSVKSHISSPWATSARSYSAPRPPAEPGHLARTPGSPSSLLHLQEVIRGFCGQK